MLPLVNEKNAKHFSSVVRFKNNFDQSQMKGNFMYYNNQIYIAQKQTENGAAGEPVCIELNKANRHGLIAGATGTGKTITLKVMAESFSDAGVPVFLADVKGDLSGMCKEGMMTEDMQNRMDRFALADTNFALHSYPVTYWDLYEKNGLPLRTTITEMGPTLLAQLLELTATQEDILNIIFRIADDEGLLLIDSKDLRSMISYVADHSKEYSEKYGNMAKASLNVIQRGVASLEAEGADRFFGEPALNIRDWIRTDTNGQGFINILDSRSLINSPRLYATFMLWMLSELFEIMPEVGDLDKPRMVFFFDEAHLLFDGAPKALVQKIEQVVKLIRSKGVGIYFITQNPKDIPDAVLSQLGNKVQHALHAYTPADQKGLKAAAQSFRINPEFDTLTELQELGTGEAIVSFLEEDGTPGMAQKVNILPPQSLMGPVDDSEREKQINMSPLYFQYGEMVDRDSAYEFLQRLNVQAAEAAAAEKERIAAEKAAEKERVAAEKAAEKERLAAEKAAEKEQIAAQKAAEREAAKAQAAAEKAAAAEAKKRKNAVGSVAKTAGGTVGREVGKTVGNAIGGKFGKTLGGNVGASIGRGILGTLFGK